MSRIPIVFLLLGLAACGGVAALPDAGASVDGDPGADAAVAPDASTAPTIAEALDCGAPASAGGLRDGTDLQRVDLDLAAFPQARCNDGTGAAFYFRPAATPAGAKAWVIQLQGGGGCHSPDECARRWCSVGTNFGMTQMSSDLAPATGTVADGILFRGKSFANPLEDANQVLVRYCSSDEWTGRSEITVDAAHPTTGDLVRYRIDFHGADILDAVIATLRRDGATVPAYTLGGGAETLADLDDATDVMLAGASAGGAGWIHNADRITGVLRANNSCPGVDCALQISTLVDSIFAPRGDALDWTTSTPCLESGACSWEQIVTAVTSLYELHGDDSCATWHAANAPATAYLCGDPGHVIRNHVTTPMMVRMGLADQLIGGNMIASGVTVPGQGPLTPARFATLVHDQLVELAQLPTQAEEGASGSIVRPATFGPPCPDHETLSNNESTFQVTVTAAGAPRSMLEVFGNWWIGAQPVSAVWGASDPIDCGAP